MSQFYYKIGEAAEILGIEQYTLRYLETTLKLKIKRDDRSDRIYTEEDIETFRLILKLKNEKGLNTTAIKMALENMEENRETAVVASSQNQWAEQLSGFANQIIQQNNDLLTQNRQLQEQISKLEEKITRLESRRSDRLDELITLWRNEQDERNKSWIARLKRK